MGGGEPVAGADRSKAGAVHHHQSQETAIPGMRGLSCARRENRREGPRDLAKRAWFEQPDHAAILTNQGVSEP
jgi:hypothetical protein